LGKEKKSPFLVKPEKVEGLTRVGGRLRLKKTRLGKGKTIRKKKKKRCLQVRKTEKWEKVGAKSTRGGGKRKRRGKSCKKIPQ